MQDSKVLTAEEKQLEIEKIQADKRFVGHPVGVLTIGLKFMCNSFSYYGLTSILIYYLYAALPAGLGLTKTEASQLLSLYYALVIICGVIGSYMADRVFGPRMAIRLTCIVMPIAYLLLAIPGLGIVGYAGAQGMMLFSSMLGGRSMDELTAVRSQLLMLSPTSAPASRVSPEPLRWSQATTPLSSPARCSR